MNTKRSAITSPQPSSADVVSSRELMFCQRYVETGKKAESARYAGYAESSAPTTANRLLEKPRVRECIQKIAERRDRLSRVNAENVILELAKVAFFDFTDVIDCLDNDGRIVPEKWSEDARSAVSSVKVTRTYGDGEYGKETKVTTEVKTWDRLRALKALGDHVGAFNDLNVAIATLKTYGIALAKIDGEWQVIQQ